MVHPQPGLDTFMHDPDSDLLIWGWRYFMWVDLQDRWDFRMIGEGEKD